MSNVKKNETIKNCINRQRKSIKTEIEINGKLLELEQRVLTKLEEDTFKKMCIDLTSDEDVFKSIMDIKNRELLEFFENEIPKLSEKVEELKKSCNILSGKEKLEKSEELSKQNKTLKDANKELAKLKDKVKGDDVSIETLIILEKANKKIREATVKNDIWLITTSLLDNIFFSSYAILDGKKLSEDEIKRVIENLDTEDFDNLVNNVSILRNPTKEDISEVKPV